jgi:twinkle protein
VKTPTDEYAGAILQWLDQGLLLYDKVGKCSVDALLEIFNYCRAKYGCDQFIVDSLMRLGIASDDYVGQEQAVFKMVDWAISNGVHLHLVVHARKGSAESGPAESEDIKGASEIGANAFNIITIWRNKKVEPDGGDTEGRPEFTEKPGVTINIAKQRNGNFEGKMKFFFSNRTQQYFSVLDDKRFPRSYVELERAESAA